MARKIGTGVRPNVLGRKISKFKAQYPCATWGEVGHRFGISTDYARVLSRIADEIPPSVAENLGSYKCKAILDGKVPRNHRRAFFRIATMTEERELRRLIAKLYGDPKLRDQIEEFGCIVCAKPIDFDRMRTMQCAKCDGERGIVVKVDFRTKGELCLA